jgi:hypothetical protein
MQQAGLYGRREVGGTEGGTEEGREGEREGVDTRMGCALNCIRSSSRAASSKPVPRPTRSSPGPVLSRVLSSFRDRLGGIVPLCP